MAAHPSSHLALTLMAALATGRVAAQAPAVPETAAAPSPLQRVLGEVGSVDQGSRTLTVKTEAGQTVVVIAEEKATYVRALPGARDLQGATPLTLGEIAAGDRVLARGRLSADGATLTARQVVVMTRADLTQKHESERSDWARRGISGIVTALDPATQEITVETRSLAGPQAVVVATTPRKAGFRRYAPDSVKFSEARQSAFADLQMGDQIRALGDRAPEGGPLLAEQVVSGSFRTVSGALKSVGEGGRELTILDNETRAPLTVVVGPETMVRRIPSPLALRLAARGRGGAAGPAGERRPGGEGRRGPSVPGGAEDVGPRRIGGGTLQDMLERLPPLPVSDLKPGDQLAVSSTRGKDPSRLTAVVLLAGIEPILESRPRGAAGGEATPGLPPGALDIGFGVP